MVLFVMFFRPSTFYPRQLDKLPSDITMRRLAQKAIRKYLLLKTRRLKKGTISVMRVMGRLDIAKG